MSGPADPIVNESTSVINVNTRGLSAPGNPIALVYISTTTTPGQFVTIRDQTGTLSSPQAILISTTGGASIQPIAFAGIGTTSTLLQQRFSYLSLVSDPAGGGTWRPVNVSAFPNPDGAPAYRATDTQAATASTTQASLASTAQLFAQQVEVTSTAQYMTYLYASTLYVNSVPLFQANPATARATIAGSTKLYAAADANGSFFSKLNVSTGSNFFARGNVSTKTGTFFVGSNMNILGSLRSPRALFSVQSSLTVATTAGITGTGITADGVTVGTTLRLPATGSISTPLVSATTVNAVSSLTFPAGQAIVNRPTGGLTVTATSMTVPSTISTFLTRVSNTLQTHNLTASAFGPSTQTLQTFALGSATVSTAINNPAGSLQISSIRGNTLSLLTNLEAPRVLVGASTFSLQGGITLFSGSTSAGVTITYPPGAALPIGSSNISTSWLISSVGNNGTLLAPAYSMSTHFTTASFVQANSLVTTNEALVNTATANLTVRNDLFLTGPAPRFTTLSTTFNAAAGSLNATSTFSAERVVASSITTSAITSAAPVAFLGQELATLSTAATSSMASRTIVTSSLAFTGGVIGNQALYSTINPSSPWLLASTFQLATPPFTTTSGLGTYFYDMMFSAASNATAYYAIIDPMSRAPIM